MSEGRPIAFRYSRGDLCPIQFFPTGGGGLTLNIKGWSYDDEVLLIDVTSTGLGGRRGRIAGCNDAHGSTNYSIDLDVLPWLPTFKILSGVTGLIYQYVSPISAIIYPIIIGKVHGEAAIESEVKGSFDWAMSALPQIGSTVYPLNA